MSATAAYLIEDVLLPVDLRQWVLTVPLAWRERLGYDGRLVLELTRIFVQTVVAFYRERIGGPPRGQSGAVIAVQRTSSDPKRPFEQLRPRTIDARRGGVHAGSHGSEDVSARA
jgi:hypothetical protein